MKHLSSVSQLRPVLASSVVENDGILTKINHTLATATGMLNFWTLIAKPKG